MLKSPMTKTADGLIKRTSSMLDEIESKTVHKAEEGDYLIYLTPAKPVHCS